MTKKKRIQHSVLSALTLLVLLSACSAPEVTEIPATTAPLAVAGVEPSQSTAPVSEAPSPTPTILLDKLISERTPAPTTAPGAIDQSVERVASATGLDTAIFLGLYATDWINLGISLCLVLAGYLIGTWLIRSGLPLAVRRTSTEFDNKLLAAVGLDIRWFVVVLALNFATERLTFLGVGPKVFLTDIYFILGLGLGLRIAWRLIDLSSDWYREHLSEDQRLKDIDPAIVLLVRMGRAIIILVGTIILLTHFGVKIGALAAVLGIGGLAFSLAARDTISDAISGFIILIDQPFRIGDRVEIQDIDTWGDVVNIGLRTTHIRTMDNRMVIIPNSIIGSNQIINYTYPDPRFRIQTHVSFTYDTDIETASRIITDAVYQVDGVLQDKPVDALYIEMGDSAMIFRVRWWIESYTDTRQMYDSIHRVLHKALDEAGIESPFPTQTLKLQIDGEKTERLSQEIGESHQAS